MFLGYRGIAGEKRDLPIAITNLQLDVSAEVNSPYPMIGSDWLGTYYPLAQQLARLTQAYTTALSIY